MSSMSQAPPTQHIPKEAHLLHIFPHHTLPDSHGQKNQTKKTGMQPSCLSFFLENGINTWPVYTRNQSLLSPLPPTCLSEIRYPKSCQFFHMFLSCCLHPHFVCVCVLSRARLCDPMDCSPPASSVHGISQARILEWVAIPFFGGSS